MSPWTSMFDAAARNAIHARIRALRADAPRRWGTMTAPEMVCHLSDQMRHALELAPVASRASPLRWSVVRWASIYLLPWPKGRVEGPSEAFLTPPEAWEADVQELHALIERFAARGPGVDWPEHALFGPMTGRDWGVFVHKHFDHHLRQFGA